MDVDLKVKIAEEVMRQHPQGFDGRECELLKGMIEGNRYPPISPVMRVFDVLWEKVSKILAEGECGPRATCNVCSYKAPPRFFEPVMSLYHDLRCPGCGGTDVDTSQLAESDSEYGYGESNSLIIGEEEVEDATG